MLLVLALPYLPQPLPSLIVHGLKYIQMAGMMLDDIAVVIFALGVLIIVSGWIAG